MNIRCITIDDEPLALEKLHLFLSRIPAIDVIGSFHSCLDALPIIRSEKPDLIFLDIEMELLNGIQFLEQIPLKPYIVIVSAYDQYALKGYEHDVADYLLKPYSFERLLKAVEKIRTWLQTEPLNDTPTPSDFLFIKTDARHIKIPYDEIRYVEGMRDYLCIHSDNKQTLASMTFAQLLRHLPAQSFVRVHKSYVVNLKHVDVVEKHEVWIGNMAIPIGQSYREAFYDILEK